MTDTNNVHLIHILYYFSGEKDGVGIYEGGNERKIQRNQFLYQLNE
jgi:hypothetical protein